MAYAVSACACSDDIGVGLGVGVCASAEAKQPSDIANTRMTVLTASTGLTCAEG